ncbi:MAG TPA: spore coat protein [Bacillota bacterium]
MALLDDLFGETTGADLNQVIAINSLAGAAAAANAYLTATLAATTPEVRRLFGEYLNQSLMAHEGLTNLALKKGWINPYDNIDNQLKMSYEGSTKVVVGESVPAEV